MRCRCMRGLGTGGPTGRLLLARPPIDRSIADRDFSGRASPAFVAALRVVGPAAEEGASRGAVDVSTRRARSRRLARNARLRRGAPGGSLRRRSEAWLRKPTPSRRAAALAWLALHSFIRPRVGAPASNPASTPAGCGRALGLPAPSRAALLLPAASRPSPGHDPGRAGRQVQSAPPDYYHAVCVSSFNETATFASPASSAFSDGRPSSVAYPCDGKRKPFNSFAA